VVRHHLRDTEEQRKYNDEHYEYFGFNQDGTFEYGKYIIFITKEEHTEIHRQSEETKQRRSNSLKGKYIGDKHWHYHKPSHNKGSIHSYETKQKISKSVNKLWESEDYRERHSKATKEAMWRPDVRQRMLDGCKKKPPISDYVRQRASEANKGKKHSKETRQLLSEQKRLYYDKQRYHKFETCYKTDESLILHICSIKNNISSEDILNFISYFNTIIQADNNYSTTDIALLYRIYKRHNAIQWNVFQYIFTEFKTALTLREKYNGK
jgi:hypothetical protein